MIYVNRIAVVTGGASGIGREVARALAARGAAVAVADINMEGAEEVTAALVQDGAKAEAIAVDVSQPEQADAMIASAIQAFGKVDILVHSAGVGVERGVCAVTHPLVIKGSS
ncbi:MAG: SDR family NAD(P)-dependent oxidoreductase [Rhodospirillales bacterium]|nr:SDR family NAD(P)-dependent oxidoreductase [Rhodospirillales bacterium]